MNWIKIIQSAIEDIEKEIDKERNMQSDRELSAELLAERYHVSSFYFQKMFSTLCSCTVGEYIRNRKMTFAGYDIVDTKESIIDIAIKYGYESNESFTRAFTRFHHITPSEARKTKANLNVFSSISLIHNITGGRVMLGNLGERGYIVKENGAIYYTKNMDKTLEWFKKTLGWYGQIESRDENNNGLYGCVSNIPIEIEALHVAPYTGIHMFYGEPQERMICFMLVEGIERLYKYVKKQGWNQISEIQSEPWGGKTCEVTTIDGGILKFFEC